MSTELAAASGTDLATQPRLVTLARGLALKVLHSPEVRGGLAAAASLEGLVVTNEAELASVADLVGLIARARKMLKAGADGVLELPKAMTKAVGEAVAGDRARLEVGEQAGKDASARYLAEKRKSAEAEQARLRALAVEQEKAHASALLEDDEAPPPLQAAPAPEFKGQARGGQTMLAEVKVLKCALVDPVECDPSWLKLDEAKAKNAFRDVLARKSVEEPGGPERPVRFAGCEFWLEVTMSTRSDFRRG
jgi:hypothetical protein